MKLAAWLASALLLPLCSRLPAERVRRSGPGRRTAGDRAPHVGNGPDDDPIEIQADGRAFEGGSLRFVLDRVGRVTDDDGDAFAVLLRDGHLVGTDDRALGYVGLNNATPSVRGSWPGSVFSRTGR